MGIFDIVVMVTGGLLIAAGLILFVTGTREGSKNNVEAFGIKLDVSNPSLLLVAVGVGLLLVPRILPDRKPTATSAPVKPASATETVKSQPPVAADKISPPAQQTQPTQSALPSAPIAEFDSGLAEMETALGAGDMIQSAPGLPSGNYELVSYQENGIIGSGIEGAMVMQPVDTSAVGWTSQLRAYNEFGQIMIYQYTGYIQRNGSSWLMMVTASSDPSYINQGETPLQLNYSEDELVMQYQYMGSNMVLAWEKID